MHKKLEEIIVKTKEQLLKRMGQDQDIKAFTQAILNPKDGKIAIIAEIKLVSPSAGKLGKLDNIPSRAKTYEKAGADCISIITEKNYFKGDPKFVSQIKNIVLLPILQKDFIIDPFQIYEAKIIGADAILLIARIISEKELLNFVNLANEIGVEPIIEINSEKDLKKAIKTKAKIIAVNARDLDTFKINVDKACNLLRKVPNKFVKLGFSGIHSSLEVEKYRKSGASAILVGTELMKTNNINKLIKELKNVS